MVIVHISALSCLETLPELRGIQRKERKEKKKKRKKNQSKNLNFPPLKIICYTGNICISSKTYI